MRAKRFALVLALGLSCLLLQAQTQEQRITVTGRLGRSMAIGAETTGWSVDLDTPVSIEGKPVRSLEIAYSQAETLEKLVNQQVRAKGRLVQQHGVESGDRMVLQVSSIKPFHHR